MQINFFRALVLMCFKIFIYEKIGFFLFEQNYLDFYKLNLFAFWSASAQIDVLKPVKEYQKFIYDIFLVFNRGITYGTLDLENLKHQKLIDEFFQIFEHNHPKNEFIQNCFKEIQSNYRLTGIKASQILIKIGREIIKDRNHENIEK